MTQFHVTFFHNETRDQDGRHAAWDPLREGPSCQPGDFLDRVGMLMVDAFDAAAAAEVAFDIGNRAGADPQVQEYRSWAVRSLSRGDVVAVREDPDGDPVAVLGCEGAGWLPVDLDAMVKREWMSVGQKFIGKAYAEGERWHGELTPTVKARLRHRIEEQIEGLRWQEPNGRFPLSPGMMLQEAVQQMQIPRVSAVAYNGFLRLPDGPETASYSILGIEGNYVNGRVRVYLLDIGTGAVPLCADHGVPAPTLGAPSA